MRIQEYLQNKKLIMDGAMGTYFSKLEQDDSAIAEKANIVAPDKILRIHREYIEAGAKLIRTNTFVAGRSMLDISVEQQKKMIKSAYRIASQAVDMVEEQVYIAADIGPITENSSSDYNEVLDEYKVICDIFIEEKAEIFLFETFSDLLYIKPLVQYIKENSEVEVFIITDFCLNKNGYTKAGLSAARILEEVSEIEEIDACGFNCGVGSGHMYQILNKLKFPTNKYMVSAPNTSYPEQLHNRMVFLDNAYYFKDRMNLISNLGINILGGCCGSTPAHIKALSESVDLINHRSLTKKNELKEKVEKKELRPNEFYEKLKSGKKVVAVELDPPFDQNYDKIMECAHILADYGIDMITMADSPMGRSRVDSILMSIKLKNDIHVPVMPHIGCRDKNMIAMRSGLLGAYINDIRNILIVTGDPVPSVSRAETTGVFDYNSIQLMSFVKKMNEEHFSDEPIYYGGALNYGRGKIEKVVERMEKKIEAGAKYFLTQPVYSKEDMDRIRYIKEHVDTKILCGIMPLVSYRNANFIKNEITGIHVPDSIIERYHPEMTKEEAEVVGAQVANEIIESVYPFVDGFYLMLPFNRVSLMDKIKIKGFND